MPRHILYAYVDGSDLDGIAEALEARFAGLVGSRSWMSGSASVVNQRHGPDATIQPGDLPDWDLALGRNESGYRVFMKA